MTFVRWEDLWPCNIRESAKLPWLTAVLFCLDKKIKQWEEAVKIHLDIRVTANYRFCCVERNWAWTDIIEHIQKTFQITQRIPECQTKVRRNLLLFAEFCETKNILGEFAPVFQKYVQDTTLLFWKGSSWSSDVYLSNVKHFRKSRKFSILALCSSVVLWICRVIVSWGTHRRASIMGANLSSLVPQCELEPIRLTRLRPMVFAVYPSTMAERTGILS